MDKPAPPSLSEQLAAALDWWREAGVDGVFNDEAASLFGAAEKAAPAAPAATDEAAPRPARPRPPGQSSVETQAAPPVEPLGGERAGWPSDWATFPAWWQADATLGAIGSGARVAPRGPAQADLLVLVPMPEAGDGETLLGGVQGRLISAMLRAVQIAPERAAIAAALPCHAPLPDWQALHAAGLGTVLQHMLTLAAPARLLVLGQDVLPLLGLEKRQAVRQLPLAESTVPLLASLAPDILLGNPRARADLWRRWLDWTETA